MLLPLTNTNTAYVPRDVDAVLKELGFLEYPPGHPSNLGYWLPDSDYRIEMYMIERPNTVRGYDVCLRLLPKKPTSTGASYTFNDGAEKFKEYLRNEDFPVDSILRLKRLKALIE